MTGVQTCSLPISRHPIGAQGFNPGLRDARTLAELVETRGGDPGDPGLLADHAQRREEDRGRTLAMSDGLARLTANDAPLLRPLPRLGLLGLDRAPSAQSLLVGGAMGYRGQETGRAHVCTHVTNAHIVYRLLLAKKNHNKKT